jgi:O-antigen/teichoic acid export membrane protein
MTEFRTLGRHVSHYFSGRVVVILLGFVSFPVFTRLFSVSDYGVLSLLLKTVLMFTVISKLGVQNSVLRFYEEYAQQGHEGLRRYYSSVLFGTASIGIVVSVLFVAGLWLMPPTVVSPQLSRLLYTASLLIAIRAMQPMVAAFLRVEGRTKTYNALDIATKAGTILVIALLLLGWNGGIRAFLLATIAVEGGVVLALVVTFALRGFISVKAFDATLFKSIVVFGLPLVAYEIASVVLDSGDRILVQHYLGAEILGYYSAAYNIAAYFQDSLMSPVNLALFPIFMKIWSEKGKDETTKFLSKSLDLFLMLSIGLAAAMIAVSPSAIVVLASHKYARAQELLPMLIIGLVLYASHIFLNAGLLIYKQTTVMAKLVFGACLVNIGLNIVLLPRVGMRGAAIATLVSYIYLVIAMGRASFRIMPFRIQWWAIVRYLALACSCIFLVSYIQFANQMAEFLIKGTAAVLLYALGLLVLEKGVRDFVLKRFRSSSSATEMASTKIVRPAVGGAEAQ